jgi:general secretion pathway protein K
MTRSPHERCDNAGFIVVAVLWILMALATLAAVYASYVGNSAVALSVTDDRLQAEECIYASLAMTAYQLSAPARKDQPLRGAFRFRMAQANIVVRFTSENSRIDLNAASKETIAGLFAVLGATPRDANLFAERVIGWRTPPKPDQQNSETDLYRASGLPYPPRAAPFNHVGELWLVAGLPPALVERALNYVTLFNGTPEIDVLDAAPEVIAALPGMTPGRLTAFLDQRELTPDPQLAARSLGISQRNSTAGTGGAVRVNTQIIFDKGTLLENESVILVGAGDEPFRVLSWHDLAEAVISRNQVLTGGR